MSEHDASRAVGDDGVHGKRQGTERTMVIPHQPGDGAGDFTVEIPSTWLDNLAARTEAEHWLHAVARASLLNLLLTDPTVVALFDRWRQTTALGRAVDAYLGWMKRTASAAGIDPATLRAALRESKDGRIVLADEAEAERVRRVLTAATPEGMRVMQEVIDAAELIDAEASRLATEAIALVRDEWELPWPWLAWELVTAWAYAMLAKVNGQVCRVNYWCDTSEEDRPAPPITFQFATQPGETIAETWERFQREADDAVIAPLMAAAQPLPRGRLTDEQIVRRYVEWWYRRRIRRESIRSLAQKEDDQRKLVRYGIAQAERWLSVANCVWKSPDEVDPEPTPER